ncbi:MAG: hypothetical protein J6P82_04950 [Bacteroidales bacterium]|jgi:hypothetical protein|nr:hypothetical protein [Bacteroidales bacterium]MBO7379005.1 hypothetical protein [Bacteroidales bacterium]MBP5764829.1 hypothetical protein [Bacteroidales bacterium]
MLYLVGCVVVLLFIAPVVALAIFRTVANTLGTIVLGVYYSVRDFFHNLFAPKPVESDIDNPDYFVETTEKPKLYNKDDGEYTSFKELH